MRLQPCRQGGNLPGRFISGSFRRSTGQARREVSAGHRDPAARRCSESNGRGDDEGRVQHRERLARMNRWRGNHITPLSPDIDPRNFSNRIFNVVLVGKIEMIAFGGFYSRDIREFI